MGTNRSWNRRPTVPVTVKKMLIRRPTVNCKRLGRADCAASECSLPPLFTSKNSCLLIVEGWVGQESAFEQESPPTPPTPAHSRFPASKIKHPFLCSNLASLLDSERQAVRPLFSVRFFGSQCEAAVVSRHLAARGFYHRPPTTCRAAAMMEGALGGLWGGPCSWLASPQRGFGGRVPGSWWNRLFRGFSLFLPCLALTANWCVLLHGTETCVRMNWGALRLSKSTSAWQGKHLFWAQSTVWAQKVKVLVLTCVRLRGPFVSTEYHLGILSDGSEVCLMLRAVSVGDMFGTLCWLL